MLCVIILLVVVNLSLFLFLLNLSSFQKLFPLSKSLHLGSDRVPLKYTVNIVLFSLSGFPRKNRSPWPRRCCRSPGK